MSIVQPFRYKVGKIIIFCLYGFYRKNLIL
nr:MAG TPA: hypothetical protein [Caudoviricetes sp.]